MPTSMRMKATFGIGDHPYRNREIHPGSIDFDRAVLGRQMPLSRHPQPRQSRPSTLPEQFGRVARNEVDDIRLQGGIGGKAGGLPHSLLAPIGVAAAQLGKAADQGDGVARRLRHHGVLRLRLLAAAVSSSCPCRPCQGWRPADPAAGRRSAPASPLRDWCPAPWLRYAWHRGYRSRRWPHGLRRGNATDDRNGRRQHVGDNLAHAG